MLKFCSLRAPKLTLECNYDALILQFNSKQVWTKQNSIRLQFEQKFHNAPNFDYFFLI